MRTEKEIKERLEKTKLWLESDQRTKDYTASSYWYGKLKALEWVLEQD